MINIPKRKDFKYIQKKKLFEGAKRSMNYNTRRWFEKRDYIIGRDKDLCQECLRQGIINGLCKYNRHIDHIIPVSEGGAIYDNNNLQLLCKKCHNKKTAKEIAARKHMNSIDDDMGAKR